MLRIITGSAKNKQLKVPSSGTRPMTDRAKSSLFNMLQSKLPESIVLDLYAGSGALGLESLSRGAKKAIFVDIAKESIDCISENTINCKFDKERYEILKMDVMDYLIKQANKVYKQDKEKYNTTKYPLILFDVIFMTPPYKDISEETIRLASRILKKDGILVTDCPYQTTLSKDIADLELVETRKYGKFDLYFYLHKEFSDQLDS